MHFSFMCCICEHFYSSKTFFFFLLVQKKIKIMKLIYNLEIICWDPKVFFCCAFQSCEVMKGLHDLLWQDVNSLLLCNLYVFSVLSTTSSILICVLLKPGKTCDSIINHCECNPCFNGGSCQNRVDGYYCHCPFGK